MSGQVALALGLQIGRSGVGGAPKAHRTAAPQFPLFSPAQAFAAFFSSTPSAHSAPAAAAVFVSEFAVRARFDLARAGQGRAGSRRVEALELPSAKRERERERERKDIVYTLATAERASGDGKSRQTAIPCEKHTHTPKKKERKGRGKKAKEMAAAIRLLLPPRPRKGHCCSSRGGRREEKEGERIDDDEEGI